MVRNKLNGLGCLRVPLSAFKWKVHYMHELYQELIQCGDGAIVDAAMKCESVFLHHDKALVSLSGGGRLRYHT